MGFFDLFKRKDKKPKLEIEFSSSISSNHDREYFRLLGEKPQFSDYIGRDLNAPPFDDTYKTNNGYKLRELLLLVWWGKTKSGRKEDAAIPKYFYSTYSLKATTLTKRFFDEGLLETNNGRIHLSVKGKELYEQYQDLWEIHTVKNFPINLDSMFPNWNKDEFYIYYYQTLIKYYEDDIVHSTKMINYIRNNSSFDDIGNQEEYYMTNRERNQNTIADYENKIEALRQ